MADEIQTNVLSVRGLTVGFRSGPEWQNVVRDLDFDIPAGRTVAIVGESGSGKSVSSLAIMGLLSKERARVSGRVVYEGTSLLDLGPEEMRLLRGDDIAMIFQEPMTSLNPVMTLGQQVSEAVLAHRTISPKAARKEALDLLQRVRIPDAERRFSDYPHQFSGGMRQRVMIAMALAGNPRLLIADEPTTALDVTVQAQILDLLEELQRETGLSILFITHDMGVVAEIADDIVVMYRGDCVERGPSAEIFSAPKQPYTRALLAAVPRLGALRGSELPRRFDLVDFKTGRSKPAIPVIDTVEHDQEPILEVDGLTTRFDIHGGLLGRVTARVHAVEDVSFTVKRGETLSLVGESGCGKSTLGRSVLGLLPISGGTVRLRGMNISDLSHAKLAQLRQAAQMIFQDPFASLNPRLSVGTSIAEPLIVHQRAEDGGIRARVGQLLEQVGLSASMADRYPHEFSGGQRQRICIARALALNPDLIVADEAVSALDVSVKAEIINLLLDVQEAAGIAMLFVSHDMSVVERVSHRIAVMYLGQVVEIGPREAILGNPQHPYTQRLIAAVPIPDPSRRGARLPTPLEEIPSPVRPLSHVVPKTEWRSVGRDHSVLFSAYSS
ncbi:ABC transporter ATP-binding protein [Palleronia sp. LCG004]|uniref:ABC transporter ATP-binding protein n=1 Tax=Palleronia sp. LCG004 TaxID=3079304 RepID=UPI00294224D1|nr:ABC transporter ATP-binding protein [Palleronia sp. LCG004]WOI57489.1 ABC transporter ATP-binding protein [Palleronia sp. LCG004]